VGPKKAEALYALGMRTIEDIRKKPDSLTTNQLVGLKYFEDLKERMPREEATEIYELVEEYAYKAYKLKAKDLSVMICGSYRRGKESCGDVDILISRTGNEDIDGTLEKLISSMEAAGYLKERLGKIGTKEKGGETYMGVIKLDQKKGKPERKHRRIDIKTYPRA
jgi:DNA polymerase lambda